MNRHHIYSSRRISFFYSSKTTRNSILNFPDIKTEVKIYKDYILFDRCILHSDINLDLLEKLSSLNSYYDIKNGSIEQKEFYEYFKRSFLAGDYLDLNEFGFYAVTLLYDLINEYETYINEYKTQRNINKLEQHLIVLSQCYPNTKDGALNRLGSLYSKICKSYVGYDIFCELGNVLKSILSLNKKEIDILNYLSNPNNQFCNIEFCLVEVSKLYLLIIKEIDKYFLDEATSFMEQITEIAENSLTEQEKQKQNEYQYYDNSISYLLSKKREMCWKVFDSCENIVRELYGHKERIDTERYFVAIKQEDFESKIMNKVRRLLPTLTYTVKPPDESTEFLLNTINPSRWREKYNQMKANFSGRGNFSETVMSLVKLNLRNPNVKTILFETSTFIAKYDRKAALILYIYYIYFDHKSKNENNRKLPKYIQKELFDTEEQILKFHSIINNLLESNDIQEALKEIQKVYNPRRKYISLEKEIIIRTEKKYNETIELLNEFISENEGDIIELNIDNSNSIDFKEIREFPSVLKYVNGYNLAEIQIELLNLFSENKLILSGYILENFAREKGVFKNALIESINDFYYEVLNDSIIEETEEDYQIDEEYYKRILQK